MTLLDDEAGFPPPVADEPFQIDTTPVPADRRYRLLARVRAS